MAGIYIHIPFCKQACHYCNFHFSTNLKKKNDFLDTLLQEIVLRKIYLHGEVVETIYFGGGTPTLLSADEISKLIDALHKHFTISSEPEITIEANPDDLDKEKISSLRKTPINRFSIGVQSFRNEDLQFMNRGHNSSQAFDSVKKVQDAGFSNITLDLIYGVPTLNNEQWMSNLQKTFELAIPHLSAYCLTVEPKTALQHLIKTRKAKDVNDEISLQQYEMLMMETTQHGFDHYEISNFAQPGFYSKHNSSYWSGKKYLGFGPSAHSFDGQSRQWNVSNNVQYIRSIQKGELNFEKEILSKKDKLNEYILTSLRTKWGADLNYVAENFGDETKSRLLQDSLPFIQSQHLEKENGKLLLTKKGKFLSDKIISELFTV